MCGSSLPEAIRVRYLVRLLLGEDNPRRYRYRHWLPKEEDAEDTYTCTLTLKTNTRNWWPHH